MSGTPNNHKTHREIQSDLHSGKVTCVALVQDYITNIEHSKHLNIYVEVFAREALDRARDLDRAKDRADRSMGKLFGVVISIKDVISYEGHQLTAGSKILSGYRALFSATAVERLLAEDAIIIGRTNCDEFAMGSDNKNSFYGPVRNSIDKTRISGGSSGGAAVSVQANTCLMALGSDTGGSVRQPASFCDLIGFKPSYGRISRHGLIAYGSSFDQIGVIGRDLNDICLLYEIMSGPDGYDGTLVWRDDDISISKVTSPLKLAYIKEAIEHEGLDPLIKKTFEMEVQRLKAEGHTLDPVSLKQFEYVIPTYYVLTSAEASSNLSRYDGIRYGYRADNVESLHDMYTMSRTQGFGTEVKRRILLGTFVLSVGYYDAYFGKAQKVRRRLKDQFDIWNNSYDGVILPTTPTTAWALDEEKSVVENYLADIYSVLANLVGAPSLSLPLGYDNDDLPFGLQVITSNFGEERLFFIGNRMLNSQ